jgi:hypothetical protein
MMDEDTVELHEWLSDDCIAGRHKNCAMGECECDCHEEPDHD